jgi:GNAT superfamily N-acetyltransferase
MADVIPHQRALSQSVVSGDSGPLVIRDPAPDDEGAWRVLWAGYCAFYEKSVPEAVTAGTWARILTPGSPLFGRIAQWKGDVVGFTVSILHQGSWTLDPICYLEDLFVAPSARGRGIGRALIADLLGRAKERGWSRLYWHTRESNAPARRLYNEFATADDFVRYRLNLR